MRVCPKCGAKLTEAMNNNLIVDEFICMECGYREDYKEEKRFS